MTTGQRARDVGRKPRLRGVRWLAVAALVVAFTGCFDDSRRLDEVWVRNNTDVTLHFTIVLADGRPFDMTYEVSPGETIGLIPGGSGNLGDDGCTAGDLIAYDPSGREVARHAPGLCARTRDLWRIGPDALWVRNGTTVKLHFTIISADGTPHQLPTVIAPGETGTLLSVDQQASAGALVDGCTVRDLIAYDPSGREVARHRPPLCVKSQDHWTVGSLGSPQPSG